MQAAHQLLPHTTQDSHCHSLHLLAAAATSPSRLEDVEHAVQVVHRALHRGANVDVDDGGAGGIGRQLRAQLVVVDLAALQSADLCRDRQGQPCEVEEWPTSSASLPQPSV